MVLCPNIEEGDHINYAYFIYIQLYSVLSLALVIIFTYFIWKELKERIVDLLKILQYSAIVFWFSMCIVDNIVHLWFEKAYKYAYVILFQIDWFILIYYALNQFSWFVISLHLTWYKQMGSDANYSIWRNNLIRKERIWLLLLITCYILIITGSILPFVLSGKEPHQDPAKVFTIIYFLGLFAIELTLAITEILLYRRITAIMKVTLSYYYQKHRRQLKYLWTVNAIFLFSISTLNIVMTILQASSKQAIAGIIGWVSYETVDNWIRIIYLLVIIVFDTFTIVYIILNTKQMKFKNWLMDIFLGYRMMSKLSQGSIFIRKYSSKKEIENEAETSFYSRSSGSKSIRDSLVPKQECIDKISSNASGSSESIKLMLNNSENLSTIKSSI